MNKIVISCSGKFYNLHLAEELIRHGYDVEIYTTYYSRKNRFWRLFVKREDVEIIDTNVVRTLFPLAVTMKLFPQTRYYWNAIFDFWVCCCLFAKRGGGVDFFIGWSGMSSISMKMLKRYSPNTKLILERGSSHIEYQNQILKEEYKRFGIEYSIPKREIRKEKIEYSLADRISCPSLFVTRSFLSQGISEKKLQRNNYGTYFKSSSPSHAQKVSKFIVLYLGTVSIQKGCLYLFQAIKDLPLEIDDFEFWIIGGVKDEMKDVLDSFKRPNWRVFGFIQQQKLPELIQQTSVAVFPSLQEGLAMVIPQVLSLNIPVIATTNTGAEDLLELGYDVEICEIRDSKGMREGIMRQHKNYQDVQGRPKRSHNELSWAEYGKRYNNFLKEF